VKKIFYSLLLVIIFLSFFSTPVSSAGSKPDSLNHFSDELKTDPFLVSLVLLKDTANQIKPESSESVGQYLKDSLWYGQEIIRLKNNEILLQNLNVGLKHLDNNTKVTPGQKIQCLGLSVLLASMDNRFLQVGGYSIETAAQIIPREVKNGSRDVLGHAIAVKTLEEIQVGDLGVSLTTKAGHIFAIIGKKRVDSQTILLVISANQNRDGQISIFEVDNHNFADIFGYRKVILRKYQTPT
jgi:hypothetical protein